MNVIVALDLRYALAPDGSVWSQFGMARQFWERYLEVFDMVTVVARATRVDAPPRGWLQVNSANILLHPVPDFRGPFQYIKRYPAIRAAIQSAAKLPGAVILRVGSEIANLLERALENRNRTYALEVVGDPYEVFAPGVVDHPLRPFFRWYFSRRLRHQCKSATGVAYVTRLALQKRYPTPALSMNISDVDLPDAALLEPGFSTHYSSVELDSSSLTTRHRDPSNRTTCRVVSVGSLAQLYKGTDVLIEALARCVRSGLDVTCVIVGDGAYRQTLMAQAALAGMSSRVQFPGQVGSGEPVREILDTADLFVLPSRTEGLPRALIEAMARALPCIGSEVGGIPELLDPSDMVPPGDPAALAAKIREVLNDRPRMTVMSARNLACAREYHDSVLAERRRRFYCHVRDFAARRELRAVV